MLMETFARLSVGMVYGWDRTFTTLSIVTTEILSLEMVVRKIVPLNAGFRVCLVLMILQRTHADQLVVTE